MSIYADDTSLCYQSHDLTRLNEAINSDLKKLDTWLKGNKLSLNVAKTNSMLISTKQKQNNLKSQNKDLDLMVDENLKWDEQFKTVKNKICGGLAALKKLKIFSLSRSYVLCILRYC